MSEANVLYQFGMNKKNIDIQSLYNNDLIFYWDIQKSNAGNNELQRKISCDHVYQTIIMYYIIKCIQ